MDAMNLPVSALFAALFKCSFELEYGLMMIPSNKGLFYNTKLDTNDVIYTIVLMRNNVIC